MSTPIFLVVALAVSQVDVSCIPIDLRQQLEQRASVDQTARRAYMESKGSKATEETVLSIDADNRAWFRATLEKCGWPTKSTVGEQAATGAWLIAQHADMDSAFQIFAASKLKAAVLAGEADGEKLALLVDRNRRLQKQPQVYGMQFNIQDKSKIVFLPVEAPESLNQRRKEIGIEPFACHIHFVTTDNSMPATWPLGVPYEPATCTR